MVHHSVCPVCSSDKINLKFRCTDYFVSREEFDIYTCPDCGFSFTQDYPGQSEIGPYYESESYISHSDTSKGLLNKLYLTARSFMLKRKLSMVTRITGIKRGTLLDIGSGTGYFAATMKAAGWNTVSIEINEKAREFAWSQFGLETLSPDKIHSLAPESFDCITLWHVLEHFHDLNGYLSEISRLLKPEGRCIIALPNSISYDAGYYRQSWAAWDVPRHLWHFTPATFKILAEKSGFKLNNIRSLPLDVFYISLMSEKYAGSKFHFIRGLIHGKWFFIKSLFSKRKGSSLIYILQKQPVN